MNEKDKQDMRIYAYHYTLDKVNDLLTECKNFNNLEWCISFGCELYSLCKDMKETLGEFIND